MKKWHIFAIPMLLSACSGIEVHHVQANTPYSLEDARAVSQRAKYDREVKKLMHEKVLPHAAGFHGSVMKDMGELFAIVMGIDKQGYMQLYIPYSTYFKNQQETCQRHFQANTLERPGNIINLTSINEKSKCDNNHMRQWHTELIVETDGSISLRFNGRKTKLKRYAQMPLLSRSVKSEYDIALKEKIARDKAEAEARAKWERERPQRERAEAEARRREAEYEAERKRRIGPGRGVMEIKQTGHHIDTGIFGGKTSTSTYHVTCNSGGFGTIKVDTNFSNDSRNYSYCVSPVRVRTNAQCKDGWEWNLENAARYLCQ